MTPGAVLVADGDDLGEHVEGAAVDVAGLRADDLRPLALAQRGREPSGDHAPLTVGRDDADAVGAEAEQAAGAGDRDVGVGADQHAQAGRALQPVGFDVPAGGREHRVARRREARDVRHLAAGDKTDAARRGHAEELDHPAGRDRLGDDERRRHRHAARVLVPGGGQPVGGHGDRQRAADDEAEVARTGGGDEPRVGVGSEIGDDGERVLPRDRQRPPQAGAQLLDARRRADRPCGEAVDVPARQPGGLVEHVVAGIHVREPTARARRGRSPL